MLTNTIEIDAGEDDEDCDCQCLRSYAASSIGSPPPKCLTLDDDGGAEDAPPICVYDPEWFGLPPDVCPRILVSFASPPPQAIGRSVSTHASSPALAISSGMPSHYAMQAYWPNPMDSFCALRCLPPDGARTRDHCSGDYIPLLHVPPRMQTSTSRVASSYAFDMRWACRKRLSKRVRHALDAARRLDRSRRITLRRMWCCFPEAAPPPILHGAGEESKICASPIVRRLHQPEHLEDRQELKRAATVEPRGPIDIIADTTRVSPTHIHSANLASIGPVLHTSWLFKTISTFVHRSPLQRFEGQSLDKRSLEGLLNVAH